MRDNQRLYAESSVEPEMIPSTREAICRASEAHRLQISLPGLAAGWFMIGSGVAVMLATRDQMEVASWSLLSSCLFFWTSKAATLLRLPRWFKVGRLIGYLFWPGMQPWPFLQPIAAGTGTSSLWASAAINLFTGGLLLWGLPHLLPTELPFSVRVWVGMIGYAMFILFGVFDLVAAVYRHWGIPVEKLWHNPVAAVSLADFWSHRWNRIFSGFARDMILTPLARRIGPRRTGLIVFLFSGLLHEYAWSFSVQSGYGGPLLYFLVQWLGFQVESTRWGRWLLRRSSLQGRLWTWAVVLFPVPLLLHTDFMMGHISPLLIDLGVPGL
jgi:alginate O-acetyltransferase complex protein AlgI